MKQCSTCKRFLPESEFCADKSKADGLRSECKECRKQYREAYREKELEYAKQYREANREKVLEYNKQWRSANHEQIRERMKQWRSANREQISEYNKQYNKQYYAANREQISEYNKQYNKQRRVEKPEHYLWKGARDRAKRRGLEFNIEVSDIKIPEYCPVLGLRLEQANGRMQDNSPTLDRIDSSKGYVKGNIEVISWRANRLKNDATIEELEKITAYYKRNAANDNI